MPPEFVDDDFFMHESDATPDENAAGRHGDPIEAALYARPAGGMTAAEVAAAVNALYGAKRTASASEAAPPDDVEPVDRRPSGEAMSADEVAAAVNREFRGS